jgi:CheY-like chemotaxis protein
MQYPDLPQKVPPLVSEVAQFMEVPGNTICSWYHTGLPKGARLNGHLLTSRNPALGLIDPNERVKPLVNADGPEGTETQALMQSRVELESLVMIVEDDEALRWMLGQALIKDGLEVITAGDGKEAVQLFQENIGKIWLVVADVILRDMDGLTAAIEMRKIDDGISFIFMSGYDSQRIDSLGIKMADIPHSDFFQKPFAFKDMTNRIRVLERQRKGIPNAT